MALKLDNNLLEELGLGALPDSEKQLLLRQIYEKLEMNVGMRLADQMSNEQLDAFEKFVDANDDKGAFQWLEQNFPNYKLVVNEEFEKLKAEIRSVAPQILASAQQPQYYQQPQPQYPPANGPAIQQNGHLQPQYGSPVAPSGQTGQYQTPSQSSHQQNTDQSTQPYSPEQPPAGPQ